MTEAKSRDPLKPDATQFNPDPEYIASLVNSSGLTKGELATLLGYDIRTIQLWISGGRQFKYPVQYTLEALVLHP